MSVRMEGDVVVVTGAGAGLGRAYALEMAGLGASVVVNDIGESAERVAEEIRSGGGDAIALRASVADRDAMADLASRVQEKYGRVDALVHNAGILRDRTLAKLTEADIGDVIAVHLRGAFNVVQAVLPAMFSRGYGRIVLVTSSSGLYGLFGQSNYAAAKMGLVGLANAAKIELERKGVLINCVAPSAMTAMTEGLVVPEQAAKMQAEHVAPAVAFLCSRACQLSGAVMTAGARHFALDRMVESAGVTFEGEDRITADMVAAALPRISDFTGSRPFHSGADQLAKITGTEPQAKEGSR